MKSLNMSMGLCLLLSGAAQAADMKCYVELVSGQRVVLHGSVADSTPQAVQDKFKQRGYEVNGVVQPVFKLLECQPLGDKFQSKEGRQQDELQLR